MSERSFKTRPQCGLCNAVSNVFRRLLCVGPSRRGSSESYYQQLDPMEAYERESEEIQAHSADEVRKRDEQNDDVAGVLSASENMTTSAAATATREAEKRHMIMEESNTTTTTITTTITITTDPGSRITRAQIQEEPTATRTARTTVLATAAYSYEYDEKSLECKRLTESEALLINTMEIHSRNGVLTGRFLTMHKRRRKKLTTRSLSPDLAPALLDDVHHGVVKCMLDRAGQWPFNAFTLDVATGGRSLPVLCVHLFHWYGLLDFFKLEVVDVWKLFTLIEEGYHSTNPYHNSIHATDVTQAMHCFLQEEKIKAHITPLEVMASLIAAVSHDLDHPGVNQPFLIATSNHLAALYQNTSVLENHHWRSAVGCLLESHVADRLRNAMPELERQISSLILATDITRQQEFLTKFKRYLIQDSLQMEKEEDRHFILQIALKCADISNPCRPWEISRKWSQKVCEEFFRQGDYEQQLGLPLTALCDRSSSSVPKIQSGFFKFVVIPLFDEWHRFLGTKLSTNMMTHLKTNHRKWEILLQQELAEETRTEISDADDATKDECVLSADGGGGGGDDDDENGGGGGYEDVDNQTAESRRCSLPSVMLEMVDRTGRRHSVPLNLSRDVAVPGTSSGGGGGGCGGAGRRESLPASVLEPRHKLILDPIPHLEEEDEELDMSFRSSCSGSLQKSSDCGSVEERPVSAESLLPEPSIATITTSLEATRLSNVLHGSTMLAPPVNKILTRQQTFPPIQTFVRTRYLSTAGEIVAQPSASNSSSTTSSRNELCSSSVRTGSTSSEASDNFNAKRDSSSSEGDRDRDRTVSAHHIRTGLATGPNSNYAKMAKFSEKENVDPRKDRRGGGGGGGGGGGVCDISMHHGSLQELLLTRRGSASAAQESVSPPRDREKAIPRRGSVPIEISRPDLLEMSRRRSSDSGKGSRRSSRNRKSLKRRSSGGPDILLPREKLNTPRRGSLPCDVLPTNIKK